MRDTSPPRSDPRGDVVLGDDWVAPDTQGEQDVRPAPRPRRGLFALRASPLTRKIVMFNLIALNVLAAGMLWLTASRDSFAVQRVGALISDAALVSDVIEAGLPVGAPVSLATGDGIDLGETMAALRLRTGTEVFVFDAQGTRLAETMGKGFGPMIDAVVDPKPGPTYITDALMKLWAAVSGILSPRATTPPPLEDQIAALVTPTVETGAQLHRGLQAEGGRVFAATSVIEQGGAVLGVVVTVSAAGEIDAMQRAERERMLQMFVIATLVSIVLSLALASTITNPLADLAEAAELGRDHQGGKKRPSRIRIPDLTGRPDEIGRLSGALRGMVSALYNRIESNEQFAADVAHEIKNPLASLRSAVGTLRVVKRDDQRDKLLDVIEHDVRRLDRLVSDISNASRLDSELVKEEEEEFDLLQMLENLNQYLGEDARSKGIDYITDMPAQPIMMTGLEARLAQVFVNLITNAISFCEEGDAIRVWARKRENRILVVVEDTGPGIPEQALTKIFKRFYSQRPEAHFGNNSGLGLAISKQIVEAHGGVIWAENIRPTSADVTSEPLGARFVVGLPV